MKRTLIILCNLLIIACLLAFTFITEPNYEKVLDKEFKSEFVNKTSSNQLKSNLLDVYSHEFDDIMRVDVHLDASEEYYFVAYGKKDQMVIAHRISASEEMASKEYYPSRKDMGIESDAVVINCYCKWILCLPGGKGKFCGVALDYESDCKPSAKCPIKIDQKNTDD
ncbi:MAG: hypothetical protein AAGA77_18925 [Bacteroidota bacterium]